MNQAGKRSRHSDEVHEETAQALRDAVVKRKMSISRLAKLSGVSRRHIASALHGDNISLGVLKKLMRTLQITHIDLGGGLHAHAAAASIDAAAILATVDELERGTQTLTRAAAELRAQLNARPAVPMNRKAAALVREAAAHAHESEAKDGRPARAPRARRQRGA